MDILPLLRSPSATVTADNARMHLEHFCAATIPKVAFADEPRPEFIIKRTPGLGFSAKVLLPASVAAELRESQGSSTWKTEKMAKRDAAFEAYAKLYRHGLLNDNLLPILLPGLDELGFGQVGGRQNIRSASTCIDPWHKIAASWADDCELSAFQLHIAAGHQTLPSLPPLLLILPTRVDLSLDVELHWAAS